MTEKIITKKEVEYVAKLAKLEFNEEEKEEFTAQLNSILDYFKKLNELDTERVEPTDYVISMPNLLNEDKVKPSLPQDEVLFNSKYVKKDYFKVPKIMWFKIKGTIYCASTGSNKSKRRKENCP